VGDNDILIIKEGLTRVEAALTDLTKAVNDFRVLVAKDYVRKDDFDKFQDVSEARVVTLHKKVDDNAKETQKALGDHAKEERANRWKFAGVVATVTGIIVTVIQWIVSLARGGGHS
jgi:t-SNARE complex subunit (syntaxin)